MNLSKVILCSAILLISISVWAFQKETVLIEQTASNEPVQLTRVGPESNTRQWQVSIQPTAILMSYYDYMIGSYNSLPMHIVPDSFGGGVLMTFHGKRTATGLRRIFFPYLNDEGVLQTNTELPETFNYNMGYPVLDFDLFTGKSMYAWHGNGDGTADSESEVYGTYNTTNDIPEDMIDQFPIFNPGAGDAVYQWPIVKIGPSPVNGMRRAYVLATNASLVNGITQEFPAIAYTDFNAAMLENHEELTWATMTIPIINDWLNDPTVRRRPYFSFTVDEAGYIYYSGYHATYTPGGMEEVNETDLDVFMCDNYGQGTWQHYTTNSRTPIWNLTWWDAQANRTRWLFEDENSQPVTNGSVYWKMVNSSHKNAVLDNDGNLRIPGLWASWLNSYNSYLPSSHIVREFIFNPETHAFTVSEIFPVAGEPADSIWWQPWDNDVNYEIDDITNGTPEYSTLWPFPYWDETIDANMMIYNYNNIKMTEPNAHGRMACVWQDSWRARMYNRFPDVYPQYAAFNNTPEIYISFSPDNGQHWDNPIILNNQETPALAGIKPMWVYPADTIEIREETENQSTERLYLMFYDDNSWGAASISTAPLPVDGGTVMYMALDNVIVSNSDQVSPPTVRLAQNYPNPFNPETTISYTLDKAAVLELSVYNIKGQLVKKLNDGYQNKGEHKIIWDGTDDNGHGVASGVYSYKVKDGSYTTTKKMVLLK